MPFHVKSVSVAFGFNYSLGDDNLLMVMTNQPHFFKPIFHGDEGVFTLEPYRQLLHVEMYMAIRDMAPHLRSPFDSSLSDDEFIETLIIKSAVNLDSRNCIIQLNSTELVLTYNTSVVWNGGVITHVEPVTVERAQYLRAFTS